MRGLVTFGQHDLGQRAPFPHIDLVLCRNVLIYFTPELQHRALQLFAFALREGGYLALGKAETASPLAAYFAPADEQLKVYRRRGDRVLPPIARARANGAPVVATPTAAGTSTAPRRAEGWSGRGIAASPAGPPEPGSAQDVDPRQRIDERLGSILLDAPVGAVVVDQQYDIQIINAEAIRLLGIYAPTAGKDLVHVTHGVPIAACARPSSRHFSAPRMPREEQRDDDRPTDRGG